MEEKEIKLNISQDEYLRLKSLLEKYFVKEKKQKDIYLMFFYKKTVKI